jgi:osmotically-inducible protein OsmY
VSLEGTVPYRYMKHAVEDAADECWGVKDVDNRIRVAPRSGPIVAQATDDPESEARQDVPEKLGPSAPPRMREGRKNG